MSSDTPRTWVDEWLLENPLGMKWSREFENIARDEAYKKIDLERDLTALRERLAAAEKLLREGADGFGRVLVATSDMEATTDWRDRCKAFIDAAIGRGGGK